MRKAPPPAVSQARTVPIDWPLALTSGIGAPPSGSTAAQPGSESGAAASAANAMVTGRVGRVVELLAFNASLPLWFRLDADEQLSFGDLRPRHGGQFGDRAVERSG